MRIKVVSLALFSLLFVSCTATTSTFAGSKVGYINLQRLVNESKMGKAAKQEIQKLREEKQKTVETKLNKVNNLKELLNTRGNEMNPRVKQEKIDELQKQYKDYQRMLADAKEDITREDKQLVAIILEKADSVLKKVAKREKYTIILKDPNAVGYLDDKYDITNLVLKELDKQSGKK